MKRNLLPLTTPGEVLVEEFLAPLGVSQYRLAKDIGISSRRINEIAHGKRAITPTRRCGWENILESRRSFG